MILSARVLLLCLLYLATGGADAVAEEKVPAIRWMLTGFPPKTIPDGPFRGTGYGEVQVAWLTTHIPQFHQSLELVTPVRLWHEMQTGHGVCSIDIVDVPERERWAVFTRHRTTIASYKLVVLKEMLPEFTQFLDENGAIDLDRLAASDRLTGIYVAGRQYITQINAFIDNPSRKIRIDSTIASTKILEMVASRRGDFSFTVANELDYFNNLNAAMSPGETRWPPLALLPIKGVTEQVHGHIACSRDPLGEKMIEAVDRLFDDDAMWSEFLAPERPWMDGDPRSSGHQ